MEYIWSDRKRILGMPISFTKYAMSEDRLFRRTGFFNLKDEEILLYRVRDISTSRTLWQRLFGVGTITISSTDKSLPSLSIINIKNPMEAKERIHEFVEDAKLKRRMHVGEILSDPDGSDDDLN